MSYIYRGAAFTSLILMGSALMASNALAQQARPCETCEASDPANQSAQAIGMAMQRPRGPAGPERPDCCPPVIANKAYLGTSFAFHQLPGENSSQHYGLNYTPNAAFNAQMTLWAPYAASALAVPGWTPPGGRHGGGNANGRALDHRRQLFYPSSLEQLAAYASGFRRWHDSARARLYQRVVDQFHNLA